MKLLRVLILMAVVASAMAMAPRAASAQNIQVIQKGCDTLSLDPPLVRVRFAVLNLGTIPICSVHLTPVSVGPVPADSCRILECSLPTACIGPGCGVINWSCQLTPGGGALWQVPPGGPCIFPFQKHEEFDIVLDPFYCCYEAQFDDGNGQVFASQLVCFECEKPVPTVRPTWGALKARYR
jgi:hypothetical protein